MIHYLVTCLVDFFFVFLALSKRNSPAAKPLALTAFSMALWSMELFLLTIIKDLSVLTLWFHLTRWGMFFIAPSIAFLVWRLIGGGNRLFLYLIVIPGFVFSAILSLTNLLLFPSVLVPAIGGFLPKVDNIFYCFAVGFLFSLLATIFFGAAKFKSVTHREKQRIRWLLMTVMLILLMGLISIYLVKYSFYLKLVGAIANIAFISLLFYATIQNNLMDVRSAIGVTMARASILAAIVWFYFFVVESLGGSADTIAGAAVMIVFVVAVLECYPRMLKWILPNAKKMLVKHGYEFDQVKEDTEKALNHTMNIATMLEVLDHLFLKIVRVQNYKVLVVGSDAMQGSNHDRDGANHLPLDFVAENYMLVSYCAQNSTLNMADEMPDAIKHEMEKQHATLCFAVMANKKILAIVLVGASSDLSYYRYDDIKIFEWLAGELGQVLQRLIRLNDMQDQLGEAKKTLSMLGMMSHYHHDIKAPFAIIDGVFASDMYDRDKQKDIILAQVKRGSKLIATMASILGGNRRRRVQPCALEALVKDCLFVFETSIDKVNYEFNDIPQIAGDAEDLKILFINLIKNAAEARQGHEEVVLSVKSWVEEGSVCFSFRDNGVGMSEQHVTNLWNQDYSTKEFGSGIGMQAIKRIADEHRADIEVHSEIGGGTEFIFRFPSVLIVGDEAPVVGTIAERRSVYTVETKNIH